jgi:hypothetical protein
MDRILTGNDTRPAEMWTVALTPAELRLARLCIGWLGRHVRDRDIQRRLMVLGRRVAHARPTDARDDRPSARKRDRAGR